MKHDIKYVPQTDRIEIIFTLEDGRQSETYLTRDMFSSPYYLISFIDGLLHFKKSFVSSSNE